MRRLAIFNQVSLDGYFVDAHGDMSWAHNDIEDTEWQAFVEGNASGDALLLFGRITYELMAGYWPTPRRFFFLPAVPHAVTICAPT